MKQEIFANCPFKNALSYLIHHLIKRCVFVLCVCACVCVCAYTKVRARTHAHCILTTELIHYSVLIPV